MTEDRRTTQDLEGDFYYGPFSNSRLSNSRDSRIIEELQGATLMSMNDQERAQVVADVLGEGTEIAQDENGWYVVNPTYMDGEPLYTDSSAAESILSATAMLTTFAPGVGGAKGMTLGGRMLRAAIADGGIESLRQVVQDINGGNFDVIEPILAGIGGGAALGIFDTAARTGTRAWHGTLGPIWDKFNPMNSSRGLSPRGAYFAEHPDYATMFAREGRSPGGGIVGDVGEFDVRWQNPLVAHIDDADSRIRPWKAQQQALHEALGIPREAGQENYFDWMARPSHYMRGMELGDGVERVLPTQLNQNDYARMMDAQLSQRGHDAVIFDWGNYSRPESLRAMAERTGSAGRRARQRVRRGEYDPDSGNEYVIRDANNITRVPERGTTDRFFHDILGRGGWDSNQFAAHNAVGATGGAFTDDVLWDMLNEYGMEE